MGKHQHLHDLPDYFFLDMYMNSTRGLGAIPKAPASTVSEENILCQRNDTYYDEDLSLREIAMGIYYLAMRYLKTDYHERIDEAYAKAMKNDIWQNTYASISSDAYFVSWDFA